MVEKQNTQHLLTPVSVAVGTVLGGIAWLIIYSFRVGDIEFDGPAGLMLMISMMCGGVILGAYGVFSDLRRKYPISEIISSYILAGIISGLLAGILIGGYAQKKWSYSAIHQAECRSSQQTRPAFCD